jgi:hypothetical protein
VHHLDLHEPDPVAPACTERLHKGLLRRKTGGIVLELVLHLLAIGDLPFGKDLLAKSDITLHYLRNAGYLNNVCTYAVDQLVQAPLINDRSGNMAEKYKFL